jgi:hypothetical protein
MFKQPGGPAVVLAAAVKRDHWSPVINSSHIPSHNLVVLLHAMSTWTLEQVAQHNSPEYVFAGNYERKGHPDL